MARFALLVTAAMVTPSSLGAPAAFEIRNDEGHRFTLLGSIHLLKPSHELPSQVQALYTESKALAMELDLDDLEPAVIGAQMLAAGQLPPGQSIGDHVGANTLDRTRAALQGFGVPIEALSRLEPWLMALTLMQLKMAALGFDPSHGLEQRLLVLAERDGKSVAGLENVEDQIELFDELDQSDQENLLTETLHEMDAMEEEMGVLVEAWFEGDLARLAALLPQSFVDYPELYEGLVVNRNKAFAARIQQMIDVETDVLVVVGVLHLVGEASLPEFLEQQGLEVTRLH